MTTLSGSLEEITGTVTLVVTADVASATPGDDYLQVDINDLTSDFTWNGGASNAGDSLLTYEEVLGAYLSN